MKELILRTVVGVTLAGTTLVAGDALAQEKGENYPTKPIRLIVPFPPGGSNDILARVVAARVSENLGQSIVIDNRGGAGSIIGTQLAANAASDGYTLLLGGTASLSINPSLYKKLPYDPIKDFAPISLIGTGLAILAVHPSLPVRTVKDLIERAKTKPGQIRLASPGIGTPTHLAGELFKSMAGIDMMQIQYRGGGPGNIALLAGEASACFCGIASVMNFLKDGRLRGIAVTSAKRTAIMPELPTVGESGLPGYEVVSWFAIVAPAGTPRVIVTFLNGEIRKALAAAEVKNRFLGLGVEPDGSAPEELGAYNRAQIAKWAKVTKSAGIKPE
ncbi:MAG: hypothetical protein A3G24_08855 [Betaproteobacteria bacterium RIFCSPLOWO2_12_FULL_62_13]|nr:MAG: hypothetical protein A3G24_08855 [Betaproteobacteria bacterium RIFCSPLOWO2_12_FULL_62_13]